LKTSTVANLKQNCSQDVPLFSSPQADGNAHDHLPEDTLTDRQAIDRQRLPSLDVILYNPTAGTPFGSRAQHGDHCGTCPIEATSDEQKPHLQPYSLERDKLTKD
jgi:hypothetical protein